MGIERDGGRKGKGSKGGGWRIRKEMGGVREEKKSLKKREEVTSYQIYKLTHN